MTAPKTAAEQLAAWCLQCGDPEDWDEDTRDQYLQIVERLRAERAEPEAEIDPLAEELPAWDSGLRRRFAVQGMYCGEFAPEGLATLRDLRDCAEQLTDEQLAACGLVRCHLYSEYVEEQISMLSRERDRLKAELAEAQRKQAWWERKCDEMTAEAGRLAVRVRGLEAGRDKLMAHSHIVGNKLLESSDKLAEANQRVKELEADARIAQGALADADRLAEAVVLAPVFSMAVLKELKSYRQARAAEKLTDEQRATWERNRATPGDLTDAEQAAQRPDVQAVLQTMGEGEDGPEADAGCSDKSVPPKPAYSKPSLGERLSGVLATARDADTNRQPVAEPTDETEQDACSRCNGTGRAPLIRGDRVVPEETMECPGCFNGCRERPAEPDETEQPTGPECFAGEDYPAQESSNDFNVRKQPEPPREVWLKYRDASKGNYALDTMSVEHPGKWHDADEFHRYVRNGIDPEHVREWRRLWVRHIPVTALEQLSALLRESDQ